LRQFAATLPGPFATVRCDTETPISLCSNDFGHQTMRHPCDTPHLVGRRRSEQALSLSKSVAGADNAAQGKAERRPGSRRSPNVQTLKGFYKVQKTGGLSNPCRVDFLRDFPHPGLPRRQPWAGLLDPFGVWVGPRCADAAPTSCAPASYRSTCLSRVRRLPSRRRQPQCGCRRQW
jgi:hypothetical protein